jgi:hypothetical protein
MDLEERFAFEAEGPPGFSRQRHAPAWAHGNNASHALASIPNRPIAKLPLDRLGNDALSSPTVMKRSVLTTNYWEGTALSAVTMCPERETRIGQADHAFPKAYSQTRWTCALRFTP